MITKLLIQGFHSEKQTPLMNRNNISEFKQGGVFHVSKQYPKTFSLKFLKYTPKRTKLYNIFSYNMLDQIFHKYFY